MSEGIMDEQLFTDGPRLIPPKEAAYRIGVAPQSIGRYIRNGQLDGRNVSTGSKQARWMVFEYSVENFILRRNRISSNVSQA